jgi:hypothetical protein
VNESQSQYVHVIVNRCRFTNKYYYAIEIISGEGEGGSQAYIHITLHTLHVKTYFTTTGKLPFMSSNVTTCSVCFILHFILF